MFVEIRKIGRKEKYYLVHSFRQGNKVRKIRRYLGTDLSPEKMKQVREIGEKQILTRVNAFKRINDPLLEVLSTGELNQIKELQAKQDFSVFHLSENQWKQFTELFTYNTNAIEGSELNQKEVREVLEKSKWPRDKSKEDIAEALGVQKAIQFIRETKEHISIDLIKKIHYVVFENSKPYAGQLREKGIEVVVRDRMGTIVHEGAPSEKVSELLKELVEWYSTYKKKYPPILLASVVHNQFENIHPFEDGNGRVGRILMNNILLKHSLPPVNIDFKRRKEYYQSLQEYEKNHDIRPTIELLLREYKELRKQLR
ncbi:MAG: Fic family protein [archaeon]